MNEPSARDDRPSPTPDLVGYDLDLLDAGEREAVRRMLKSSEPLQREWRAVRAALAPLAAYAIDDPDPAMATRVLNAVHAAAGTPLRLPQRRALVPAGESAPAGDRPVIAFRELVGLAAAIALFVGVFLPAYQRSTAAARRAVCLDNLRVIGAANDAYAVAHAGALPFAGELNGPWLQNADAGAVPVGNSRHLFLLSRGRLVPTPQRFVCPARPQDQPVADERLDSLLDFPDIHNVSYSSAALAGVLRRDACDPRHPVLSDHSSQFEERRFQRQAVANSNSHGRAAGQNVLRVDGSAAWTTRSDVGPGGDDIFNLDLPDLSEYTGWERPYSNSDVFLIP